MLFFFTEEKHERDSASVLKNELKIKTWHFNPFMYNVVWTVNLL